MHKLCICSAICFCGNKMYTYMKFGGEITSRLCTKIEIKKIENWNNLLIYLIYFLWHKLETQTNWICEHSLHISWSTSLNVYEASLRTSYSPDLPWNSGVSFLYNSALCQFSVNSSWNLWINWSLGYNPPCHRDMSLHSLVQSALEGQCQSV